MKLSSMCVMSQNISCLRGRKNLKRGALKRTWGAKVSLKLRQSKGSQNGQKGVVVKWKLP